MRSSVICLEFNELTPELLQRFIDAGHLPNFQRLRDSALVCTTDAEAEGEWLNPWVQWVTVHSGLDATEHEVFRLSNAYRLKIPAIWDTVSAAGGSVWVCGSMNPWHVEELNGRILPDPWSHQVHAYPKGEFDDFDLFVRKQVQDYAASKSPVTVRDRVRFVGYLLSRGLTLDTIIRVLSQLGQEWFGNHRWKRARLLDAMQWDLFEWYYRRDQPNLATFFTNVTAHYQHRYWRNLEPEAFLIRPTAHQQRSYQHAILQSYQQLDRLVGKALKLNPEATIMLISGLGQQPFVEKDREGGVRYYRLHGKSVLIKHLNLPGDFSYEPIMADQFFLRFVNTIDAETAGQVLQSVRLPDGSPAFDAEIDGNDVIAQCKCRHLMPKHAYLSFAGSNKRIPFDDIFYWVESLKSGTHHPQGVFWIRQPGLRANVRQQPVSLTTIAPTILDCLGLEKLDFMPEESILKASLTSRSSVLQAEPVCV